MTVTIGSHEIGEGLPSYVIGEIGLNHNGSVEIAKRLIDVAADAGAQAVKFQKRTPAISTPEHMKAVPRSTPWGEMTYLEYRYRVEFDREQYIEIGDHATLRGLDWFSALAATGKPVILSTGMATMEQIDSAVEVLGTDNLVILHATATDPL